MSPQSAENTDQCREEKCQKNTNAGLNTRQKIL